MIDIWTIVNIFTAVVTLASAVAAVTPTTKDDQFIAKYLKPVIDALALNVGNAKK